MDFSDEGYGSDWRFPDIGLFSAFRILDLQCLPRYNTERARFGREKLETILQHIRPQLQQLMDYVDRNWIVSRLQPPWILVEDLQILTEGYPFTVKGISRSSLYRRRKEFGMTATRTTNISDDDLHAAVREVTTGRTLVGVTMTVAAMLSRGIRLSSSSGCGAVDHKSSPRPSIRRQDYKGPALATCRYNRLHLVAPRGMDQHRSFSPCENVIILPSGRAKNGRMRFLLKWAEDKLMKDIKAELAPVGCTLYRMCRLLRTICERKLVDVPPIPMGGPNVILQMDESCFRKKPKYRRGQRPRPIWVFGIVRTDVRPAIGYMTVVERRNVATLLPIIQRSVLPGSTVYSDEWAAYRNVENLPNVAHHGVHTKHIEAYWPSFGGCTGVTGKTLSPIFRNSCGGSGIKVRQIPQCNRTFQYQEYDNGIMNYNNITFLSLQLCFWLRNHVAVGMTSISEEHLGVSLPRQDCLRCFANTSTTTSVKINNCQHHGSNFHHRRTVSHVTARRGDAGFPEEFGLEEMEVDDHPVPCTYEVVGGATKRGQLQLIDNLDYNRPHQHNHGPDVGAATAAKIAARVKAVAEDLFKSAAAIVDDVLLEELGDSPCPSLHSEHLARAANRHRQTLRPTEPKDMTRITSQRLSSEKMCGIEMPFGWDDTQSTKTLGAVIMQLFNKGKSTKLHRNSTITAAITNIRNMKDAATKTVILHVGSNDLDNNKHKQDSFVPGRGGLRGQHAKSNANTVPIGPRTPSRQTSTANPTAGNQVSSSLHVVKPAVLTTLQQGTLKHLKLPWKQVGKNIRKAWDPLMS
ncbi:hypothetical protein Bbelb_051100 [Branchiostoma belcheri]|nr:hypothetical protein Bbelb_051100 [Branchiostoma belcheri]